MALGGERPWEARGLPLAALLLLVLPVACVLGEEVAVLEVEGEAVRQREGLGE